MLTANRLTDGEVVYWRAGQWVENYADGEIFPDDAALKQPSPPHRISSSATWWWPHISSMCAPMARR